MKYIGVLCAIFLAVISGAVGYGQLQTKSDNNKEEVIEVKAEVKEVSREVDIVKQYGYEQTILINRITDNLDRLEDKLK